MSDSATDRPELRRAINEAIGWDDRKEAASIYQEHGGRFTDDPMPYEALLAVARWGAETALAYAESADDLQRCDACGELAVEDDSLYCPTCEQHAQDRSEIERSIR